MSEKSLSRRSFLRWSALGAGAVGASGLVACAPKNEEESLAGTGEAAQPLVETGRWVAAPCYNNCSNGATRCPNRVYMEDGVPLKIRSDEAEEDSYAMPQRRGCLRGRAKISDTYSPARIKYPMKRKSFTIDDPHGELRGKDEWVRISWDEAFDLVAAGIKKIVDQYGSQGILCSHVSGKNAGTYDQNVNILNALGGALHHEAGTVSFGSWPVVDTHMFGTTMDAMVPHHLNIRESELHVMFGINWMANKAGNHTWYLQQCHKNGAKVIAIEPWLSQTASAVADEWIPILPGADTPLIQAICYEWLQAGTYDQEFLDTYCVGFDGGHMPEGAPENGSWKDYLLGTSCYDSIPKTPEWAEELCGVPADVIRSLAEEIARTDKVNFFAALSTTKIPAGEQMAQSFYAMALMHGGLGEPGHFFGWEGINDSMGDKIKAGAWAPADTEIANPLTPEGSPEYMFYPIPDWSKLEDPDGWMNLNTSEVWRNVLDGEFGRDCWPTGKRKLDIHGVYFGWKTSGLNQLCDAMSGLKAIRQMDFVWGVNAFFDPSRQHCDVVLPSLTFWEKPRMIYAGDKSSAIWCDHVIDPLYEAKYEGEIAEEIAKRLGIDPKVVNPLSVEERGYSTVRDAVITGPSYEEPQPLLTITQEEIDELFPGAQGEPQEGMFSFEEVRKAGIVKAPMSDDTVYPLPFAKFIADPGANPLETESGKIEIYCQTLADKINAVGYSTIYPVGVYQIGDPEQGPGTQTEEFPLLLWTPHSLRRAHGVNDNVVSLRQAFPQECFMSVVDAEARGIENGDTVLMTAPTGGKVLRHAKVLPTVVPGAVAMQDGGWIQIDEETGIDLGGNPNLLQAPKASGQGAQCWTGTLLQVEKYDGPLTLEADWKRPVVTPVGISE